MTQSTLNRLQRVRNFIEAQPAAILTTWAWYLPHNHKGCVLGKMMHDYIESRYFNLRPGSVTLKFLWWSTEMDEIPVAYDSYGRRAAWGIAAGAHILGITEHQAVRLFGVSFSRKPAKEVFLQRIDKLIAEYEFHRNVRIGTNIKPTMTEWATAKVDATVTQAQAEVGRFTALKNDMIRHVQGIFNLTS